MEEQKQLLIQLIVDKNVSAIETFSEKLALPKEEVITLISQLLEEGKLHGNLTSDEKRFFKSEVKMSQAPVVSDKDEGPSFLKYDIRPGLIVTSFGLIVIIIGVAFNSITSIQNAGDVLAILTFIGVVVLIIGLLMVARRKTPD